jgi:plasmid stability protein
LEAANGDFADQLLRTNALAVMANSLLWSWLSTPSMPLKGHEVTTSGDISGDIWYQPWYHGQMAMTLRLDDGESEALRQRAEHEGRSMQEVARQAVREYVERTSRRELLDQVLDEELPRYAEALRRLGE